MSDWNDEQRQALQDWASQEPSNDFAVRVVRSLESPTATTADVTAGPDPVWPSRSTKKIIYIVAAAAVMTTAVAMLRTRSSVETAAADGNVVTTARRTVAIGNRATVVAEGGAMLSWHVDRSGAAQVEQRAGNAFYRVEKLNGKPFVVHTPGGDVIVTGTCFRVEVAMVVDKKGIVSGVIGAMVATAIVVTVYEGGVVVAHGQANKNVTAGDSVTMPATGANAITATAPVVATGSAASGAWSTASGTSATPGALDVNTMTREQLLVRAAEQQRQIADLEAKMIATKSGERGTSDDHVGPHPDMQTLKRWAAECRISIDHPMLDDREYVREKRIGRIKDTEYDAYNDAVKEIHDRWLKVVTAVYIEVTGDEAGAANLSIGAMGNEIEKKGGGDEMTAVRARIANERAGLAVPPAPGTAMSGPEKFLRAMAALGDETEAALAKRVGADRAREIRGERWDSRSVISGCADEN
jgi:ferric-dicitrate binding protein FerR (iron transport regulator)